MAEHPAEVSRRRFYHSPRARRRAVVGLVIAFIFVAVVTGLFYETTLSGLAPESGVVKLDGLRAPVKVIRDAAGIPHIYAQNRLDLARALGYTQAQDRLFQLEMRRRLAEGRLAEVFGADLVESDYVYRLFDPEKFARDSVATYPPEMRAQLDAFIGGINAYIDAHQNSLEPAFRLVGITPAHYTAEDLEAGALTIAMLLGYNATEESVYMNLAPKMAPSEIAALMPVYPTLPFEPPPSETTAVFGGAKLAFHLAPGFARLGHMGIPASNNWVVDGTRTISGKPMLANDPHLPQSMPSIWYEAVLVTPDGFTSGALAAGSPAIAIGTNGHVAWGVTSVCADVMDLSLEHLSADGKSYEDDGKWLPLERRDVTVHVRDAADVTRTILSTRHGPIVSDVLAREDNPLSGVKVRGNYALSMRFAGLTPGPSAASGFASATARTGKDLVEAYRTFTTTPLNLVWGDDSGNIGWKIVGAIPNRAGFDGKYPTPGFTGKFEWDGMIPFDSLPHSENPPTHFIVTANNRLADVSWNGSWVPPWRYDRISDLIRAHDKMTVDDFKSIQRDRVSIFARKLRDALVQAGDGGDEDVRWALGEIRGWDGAMTANSRPAAIVAATEVTMARRVFKPLLGDDYKSFMLLEDGGAYPASEDMIVRPASTLWPGGADAESATLRASVKDSLALLTARLGNDRDKWRWGAMETIEFQHPLGAHGGVLGWYFNRGPFQTEGGRHTVNNSSFDLGADGADQFKVTQISSYRYVVDLGDPEGALGMNHSGESEHPASRHYDDMIGPWSRGEYHALDPSFTRAQSSAEAELDLMPR